MILQKWTLLLGGLLLALAACSDPIPYQTAAPTMLTQALEKASADGKWVLVDLGAPW